MAYYPASMLMPDIATTQSGILDSYSPSSVLSKLGEPVLYVVRHATIDLDKQDRIRGLNNPSLNAQGKKEAKETAAFFADIPLSAVVTDDLARTRETAGQIAESKGLEIETDIAFRSWDVGTELEGQPIKENEDIIKQLKTNEEQIPVGGISWGQQKRNVTESFYRWLRQAMESEAPVVIVTHGSAIQVIWELLGDEHGEEYDEIPMEPGGIGAIYLTRDGFKPQILHGEGKSMEE